MVRRTGSVWVLFVALVLAGTVATGCASSSRSQSSTTQSSQQSGGGEAATPRGVAPPAGHRLTKIDEGMASAQVAEILGQPASQQTYQTGKAWIPFYWGSDLSRTDWKYQGEGRVVFSHNRWTGNMKVIRVDYDPEENGY